MIAVKLPSRTRVRRAVPASWPFLFLVAAAIVLSAITSSEQVTFSVAGADLNLRVAAYFGVAAVAGVLALRILVAMDRRPLWLKLMLVTVAWFTFTALVAHHSPVEWLPTVVRYALYFSAATICYWFASSLRDQGQVRDVSRLLPLAILAAAAIPAIAGIAEFMRGSAPIVNGAPRVSGSMPTHPVAYSLMLVLSALAVMGPAFLLGRKRGGILRWIAVAVLTALVFTTFTRLSIVLLVAAGAAVAALLPATRRLRLMRFAGAVLVGAAVVLLAQPTFEARFTYPTPLSEVISGANQSPGPNGGDAGGDAGGDDGEIEVDNSIAYRIMLTRYGLEYLSQSPIVGHGPGSFHRLFEADSGRARVAAHNDFMSVAVETGLPGLALYVLTLASVVWILWPRRSTGIPEADALIVTALVALGAINIGAAIHNPTYFVEIELPVWILVGTALGLRERARSWVSDPTGAVAQP
jgi:O-antigen ligase